ncbi:MAG: Ni/Fe-hydrogenase cytochrome b subunit [Anaerolineae bacterium]|nr:Ni/Fe-hydrogenase cytochrome b subunit [Anaerolineae bacterium]
MNTNTHRTKSTLFYLLLAAIVAVGAGLGIVRLLNGLGTTTALSDGYPWGLWIVYDVFFVPFSGGAFMILAVTHIYNRKEYHALARPVVLAGFLGEIMVVLVLLMDLGRWHQFYNVLFPWHWNINSFMFQVSICLTIYIGVMVLEVAPAILERLNWQRPLRLIKVATLAIAGLGILLSCLHQSSLGALFLLMPYKLDPLWWTGLLPLLFFTSAVFAGLSMAILVGTLSFRAVGRRLQTDLLANLARAAAVLLGAYLVLKIADLLMAGEASLLFSGGWLTALFWAEILVGVLVPLVLFGWRRFRQTSAGLTWGSLSVLGGVALNRTNVALLAYQPPSGSHYFPNWMEIVISVSAVAAGVLLFAIALRLLPILPKDEQASLPPLGWSRRGLAFALGVLALLTVAVVLLVQPATSVEAYKAHIASPDEAAKSPESGLCLSCHEDAQVLTGAGASSEMLSQLTIEPQPLETPHGRLSCVVCHYGDSETEDMDLAHDGVLVDPTVAEAELCVACHSDLPEEFPEDRLRTPHDEVTHGEVVDVACSDCHGAVGHGFDPVSGNFVCPMSVCLDCHIDRELESELVDCSACHIEPHAVPLAMSCSDCHQGTTEWAQVAAVDHEFPLEAAHAELECSTCHQDMVWTEYAAGATCATCHQPPSEPHYGPVCEDCHTPASFAAATPLVETHPVELTGAHRQVACGQCHPGGQATPEYVCAECHQPPTDHLPGDCKVCHDPEGWAGSASFWTELAPAITHDVDSQGKCLICHDPTDGIQPSPANHSLYSNEQCGLCHK